MLIRWRWKKISVWSKFQNLNVQDMNEWPLFDPCVCLTLEEIQYCMWSFYIWKQYFWHCPIWEVSKNRLMDNNYFWVRKKKSSCLAADKAMERMCLLKKKEVYRIVENFVLNKRSPRFAANESVENFISHSIVELMHCMKLYLLLASTENNFQYSQTLKTQGWRMWFLFCGRKFERTFPERYPKGLWIKNKLSSKGKKKFNLVSVCCISLEANTEIWAWTDQFRGAEIDVIAILRVSCLEQT